MQLDQILGLAARAIQAVVDPLGRADIEARDDEADVEAEHRRLNTDDGAPFAIPGLCLVARLGIAHVKGRDVVTLILKLCVQFPYEYPFPLATDLLFS